VSAIPGVHTKVIMFLLNADESVSKAWVSKERLELLLGGD
jgi:hypothetical protein